MRQNDKNRHENRPCKRAFMFIVLEGRVRLNLVPRALGFGEAEAGRAGNESRYVYNQKYCSFEVETVNVSIAFQAFFRARVAKK